jgi:hypothetical protein
MTGYSAELYVYSHITERYINYNERERKEGNKVSIRKTRSDCRVGTFEKTRGLPPGSIRNKNGRDARSDKKIGTLRKEYSK